LGFTSQLFPGDLSELIHHLLYQEFRVCFTNMKTSPNRYSGWYIELLEAVYKKLIFLKTVYLETPLWENGLKVWQNPLLVSQHNRWMS
jgi:hypothetical protein